MSKNLIQILPCHYTSDHIKDKSSNPEKKKNTELGKEQIHKIP